MKTILVYMVLVGVPLLGLLGILRAGERMVPPRHVGGAWEIADSSATGLQSLCPGLGFPGMGAAIDVSQSGTRARVVLNDSLATPLDARIEGLMLTARPEREAGAYAGRELRLAAALDTLADPMALRGTVSVAGCDACPTVPFHAVRAAPTGTR